MSKLSPVRNENLAILKSLSTESVIVLKTVNYFQARSHSVNCLKNILYFSKNFESIKFNFDNLMIPRPYYIEQLKRLKDKPIIKILTGTRRSGKSTILQLWKNELLASGINENHIIELNLADLSNESLRNKKSLYDFIASKIAKDSIYYVFIDEIQECPGFEKVAESLMLFGNIDLYMTGSNAYVLSGELTTYLTGRYLEIKVYPFSFKEFLTTREHEEPSRENLAAYLTEGSFPGALLFRGMPRERKDYYQMLFDSMILKDVGNRKGIKDVTLLIKLSQILASSLGSSLSVRKIANTAKSFGVSFSEPTISAYLKALEDAYFCFKVPRFNLKGRQLLKQDEKYYLVDPTFRQFLISSTSPDLGHVIENIVYLELKRRYQSVYVGTDRTGEVDFVAANGNDYVYYQVAAYLSDEQTLERELNSLKNIADHYPKCILTLDPLFIGQQYSGIRCLSLLDWLVSEN